MARYVFRLKSYLNLKQKLEDQRKLEYGLALAELEHERQVKVGLENEKGTQLAAFRESIDEAIDPMNFRAFNDYIELLKKKIINQEKVIIQAEKKAEKKRVELVEAMKERKMLETLNERQYAEYLKEEQLAEQKIVDEIVSYRYNNKGADENGG